MDVGLQILFQPKCGRVVVAALFALFASLSAGAQGEKQILPANLLIPQPPPSAPLSDWVDSQAHTRTKQAVPDAELRGWDYAAPRARTEASLGAQGSGAAPILLFFNGNGMTVDRSDALYRTLERTGAEVIVYDYRGIGFSSGTPDVMAFRQDALRLYDAVAAEHPGRKVVVYGFSLGTAMASFIASERPVAGLILAGTIATAGEEFPFYMRAIGLDPSLSANLELDPNAVEAFDEVANVSHSHAPLLVLHGEADSIVPVAQGREVFAASPSVEKRFVALPGVGHNGTPAAPASLGAVAGFLRGIASSQ